jgi:choline dehydrogenase-like flavoprotein
VLPPRLIEDEIPRFTRSPHATLLSDWPVTRLVTLDGRTIDHVLARSPGGGAKKIQARVFVVAAGVVESARLLLLSRSRWFAEGLGNGSGWVGTRLVAHRSVYWTFAREDVTLVPRGIHRTYDFHDDSRRKRMSAYHYQLDVRERLVRWKLQPEMEPRAENRVTLSSTLDAFGDSTTRVSLGYSERDRRTIGHGQILLDELAGRLNKDRGSPNRREKWRAHPSGTCRMGFDESGGVVDQHQKVFGVDNLYVSGASVFPTAGTANPTLTVVALTFRLADHLLAQLSVSGS